MCARRRRSFGKNLRESRVAAQSHSRPSAPELDRRDRLGPAGGRNGRRTPDANHNLKGAISGLNLGSDAPRVFKALVEATAFGARRIVERFESEGVPIRQVIGIGGVSKKSPFVMQTLSNVLNMPIKIVRSEQACALGAAICAATAAGLYSSISEAQKAMSSGFEETFMPDDTKIEVYGSLYNRYLALGEFVEKDNWK